jgi:hypothetical protein
MPRARAACRGSGRRGCPTPPARRGRRAAPRPPARAARRRRRHAAGQQRLVHLRQAEALDLAQPRARQRGTRDHVARQALIGGEALPRHRQRDAQHVLRPGRAARAHRRLVRHHHGDQHAGAFEHRDLVDGRMRGIGGLDLLRHDVLAAAEHDQFLAAGRSRAGSRRCRGARDRRCGTSHRRRRRSRSPPDCRGSRRRRSRPSAGSRRRPARRARRCAPALPAASASAF